MITVCSVDLRGSREINSSFGWQICLRTRLTRMGWRWLTLTVSKGCPTSTPAAPTPQKTWFRTFKQTNVLMNIEQNVSTIIVLCQTVISTAIIQGQQSQFYDLLCFISVWLDSSTLFLASVKRCPCWTGDLTWGSCCSDALSISQGIRYQWLRTEAAKRTNDRSTWPNTLQQTHMCSDRSKGVGPPRPITHELWYGLQSTGVLYDDGDVT